MQLKNWLIVIGGLILILGLAANCDCGSKAKAKGEDQDNDDDTIPINDDSDDDQSDDDDLDDDDNDDADDDASMHQDLFRILLDGGAPGRSGLSLTTGPDGSLHVAAVKSRVVYIYSYTPLLGWRQQSVSPMQAAAANPALAVDQDGHLHLCYENRSQNILQCQSNESGHWGIYSIMVLPGLCSFPSLALDDQGKFHLSCRSGSQLYYASDHTGAWLAEALDEMGDGQYSSIALDASGKVHISYDSEKIGSPALKYLTNQSGFWESTVLETSPEHGCYNSLAVDHTGAAHIAYYSGRDGVLKYAVHHAGAWSTSVVDDTHEAGWFASLALDAVDHAHLAYFDYGGQALKYATNESGAWATTALDSVDYRTLGGRGQFISIAVDNLNAPNIVYYDQVYDFLRQVAYTEGDWTKTIVDDAGVKGFGCALALDKAGEAYLSYFQGRLVGPEVRIEHLLYGHYGGQQWTDEEVDEVIPALDASSSIALTAVGAARISYSRDPSFGLRYASRTFGSWSVETPTDEIGASLGQSLAIDSHGWAYILFVDQGNNSLKYAINKTGTWEIATLDTNRQVCCGVSLALDAEDHLHASYCEFEENTKDRGLSYNLMYGADQSGNWITSVVDPGGGAGEASAIALDSTGAVHIAYLDEHGSRVKYATNSADFWALDTVLSNDEVEYSYISLALDQSQTPHLSCQERFFGFDDDSYLLYVSLDQGLWRSAPLDTALDTGKYSSIQVDRNDQINIAYYSEYGLWLARFSKFWNR